MGNAKEWTEVDRVYANNGASVKLVTVDTYPNKTYPELLSLATREYAAGDVIGNIEAPSAFTASTPVLFRLQLSNDHTRQTGPWLGPNEYAVRKLFLASDTDGDWSLSIEELADISRTADVSDEDIAKVQTYLRQRQSQQDHDVDMMEFVRAYRKAVTYPDSSQASASPATTTATTPAPTVVPLAAGKLNVAAINPPAPEGVARSVAAEATPEDMILQRRA